MNPLAFTEELERVARRTVWFKLPEEAVRDPVRFIAHVLTYGMHEDVQAAASGFRRGIGQGDPQRPAGGVRRPFVDLLEPQDRAVSGSAAAGA